MPLVTSKELLLKAQEGKYAIGAFNVENMEMVQAVISAAEDLNSPVILQTTSSTLKYATPELYLAMARAVAEKASVPVVMHLDHGNGIDISTKCFRAGYTSIMIDGSKLIFEENIKLSKTVADMCHMANIPVEAELGKVGGKEDDMDGGNGGYTDPDDAVKFVKETNVDSLAVAIGTAHGVYKGIPKLDIDRLEQIHEVVDIPLVLHGTSGVPDDSVRKCIERGICKVNYATDLRIAFSNGIRQYLSGDPDVIDPKKYGAVGRDNVKAYVMDKIKVCGSVDKA